jgi:hypothetical protein
MQTKMRPHTTEGAKTLSWSGTHRRRLLLLLLLPAGSHVAGLYVFNQVPSQWHRQPTRVPMLYCCCCCSRQLRHLLLLLLLEVVWQGEGESMSHGRPAAQ